MLLGTRHSRTPRSQARSSNSCFLKTSWQAWTRRVWQAHRRRMANGLPVRPTELTRPYATCGTKKAMSSSDKVGQCSLALLASRSSTTTVRRCQQPPAAGGRATAPAAEGGSQGRNLDGKGRTAGSRTHDCDVGPVNLSAARICAITTLILCCY